MLLKFGLIVSSPSKVYAGTSSGYKDLATTITYNATIGTSWSGSGPYTQNVTVSGILSTDNPIVDVVLSSDTDASRLILEAWANISRIVANNNSITVYCYDEGNAVNIPIQLKMVR